MKNWKITKDKVLMGPPAGGVICFTVQALWPIYPATGIATPACLISALTIGAVAGWAIEVATEWLISIILKKRRKSAPAR